MAECIQFLNDKNASVLHSALCTVSFFEQYKSNTKVGLKAIPYCCWGL